MGYEYSPKKKKKLGYILYIMPCIDCHLMELNLDPRI